MAFRLGGGPSAAAAPVPSQPLTARELIDKYSGLGLQFKVKYVGSENINRRRGDAEAARYCIPTLRIASKNMGAHKPKAVLGLNLKGVSLYDERSKSVTRVPVEKVTYVSHDPEDNCYFGIIIQTKESHTGFRLYCFKAEKLVAVNFVTCARELFDVILKLRQAKKKLKEEKDAAANTEQNPDDTNLPTENAPPPSYKAVTKEQGPPERPPPPMPKQAPAMPPRPGDNSLFSFGDDPPPPSFDEVYDVFGQQPTGQQQQVAQQQQQQQQPSSGGLSEWDDFETQLNSITATDSGAVGKPVEEYVIMAPPSGRTRPQGGAQPLPLVQPPPPNKPPPPDHPPPLSTGGMDDLADVFSGSNALTGLYTQPTASSGNPNPFGATPQPPSYPPPPVSNPFPFQEPSITMDLMDAIRNPPTSFPPQGMGMGPPQGMGMGLPQGMGMGPPQGMGMGMGPPQGMGMGMGMGQPGFGGQFGQFGGGGAMPFQSGAAAPADIFSLPADPLLDTTFAQPLLPTNTGGPGSGSQPAAATQGGGAGKKKGDAFSDLVSMARNKTTTTSGPSKTTDSLPIQSAPPPLPYRPPNLGTESTDFGPSVISSQMEMTFDDTFGSQPPAAAPSGFGQDGFGDSFSTAMPPPPTQAPPPQSNGGWISF